MSSDYDRWKTDVGDWPSVGEDDEPIEPGLVETWQRRAHDEFEHLNNRCEPACCGFPHTPAEKRASHSRLYKGHICRCWSDPPEVKKEDAA